MSAPKDKGPSDKFKSLVKDLVEEIIEAVRDDEMDGGVSPHIMDNITNVLAEIVKEGR